MRKVVDFVNVVAAVLLGAYLVILVLFRSPGLKAVPEVLSSGGFAVLAFVVGLFIIAINVHVLLREWRAGGLRRNLRITTDQGTNELSVAALEMMLLRDLRSEPDIIEPIVTLTPKGEGKPILCELELKLRRQDDVIKRMDAIKRKIRDDIDRLVPGGLTVEVQAEVRDFVSEQPREQERAAPAASEFNGPVYSDDGDSTTV